MKADREATEARQFLDPKSYVAKDGREVLHGADWLIRKAELWRRADGRCEFRYPDGRRCIRKAQIPSHIEPRHPKRDDQLTNLKAHCLQHDRETEKQNWRRTRFGEKAVSE